MSVIGKQTVGEFSERLNTGGFRFTPQRQQVYDVLLQKRDHPTAEEVFFRAKKHMPDISHATVYNCLDALVECGLVRQVQLDRGAARFCPNMREHGHFYCDRCDTIYDVDLPAKAKPGVTLPKGFVARRYEIAIHGVCPECAKKKRFNASTNNALTILCQQQRRQSKVWSNRNTNTVSTPTWKPNLRRRA